VQTGTWLRRLVVNGFAEMINPSAMIKLFFGGEDGEERADCEKGE